MNRAVSVPQGLAPGSVEQVSYLTSLERLSAQSQVPAMSQPRLEVSILSFIVLDNYNFKQ